MSEPVIFLMGATASGKTDLSLSLAQRLDAEIISVDSALVYRGMDIGTAKPTPAERAAVPHHLIDICEPWDIYSAARFVDDASAAIEDIQSRGRRALLVGGTMLYFRALEDGLARLPDADEAIRADILQQAQRAGWPALHERLQSIDPEAAKRIHPNDPQRLQRALEVHRLTGRPLSELQAETRSRLACAPLKFGLIPEQRSWLHERIAARLRSMVAQGFLDEVRSLRQMPQVRAELPAMRSVGYRQAWEYLDLCAARDAATGVSSVVPPALAEDASWVDKAMAATRQLAKRQLTWLRGMSDVNAVTCDSLSVVEQERVICESLQTGWCGQ